MTNKLMLASDAKNSLDVLALTLKSDEWQILPVASTVNEAFSAARQSVPDLIVLDLATPKIEGEMICAALKADQLTAHIKIIALVDRRQYARFDRADIMSGADCCFLKPFSPVALLDEVHAMLEV